MTHIDLFSGIGGFALAVDEVWAGEAIEHIFCEIDPFCQAVLKKHWKGSEIYGDIRTLTNTDRNRPQVEGAELETSGDRQFSETTTNTESGQSGQPQAGNGREDTCRRSEEGIFLLTGGFPCQPFSQAGKRRGTSDNRFLWPEMLRVIHEFKPTWVIAENVRGLLTIEQGVVFEQVCVDLEGEGYEVQPLIIPAVSVNAPHRRDRVWILAKHSAGERCVAGCGDRQGGQVLSTKIGKDEKDKQERDRRLDRSVEGDSNAPDTGSKGLQGSERPGTLCTREAVTHGAIAERSGNPKWSKNWLEVATELCGVDARISGGVDRLKLSAAGHRVERLKALGNAVVPQVVMEIMYAIKYIDEGGK